jgi:3-oxoacyl-[acyl-carrier protein] reductase
MDLGIAGRKAVVAASTSGLGLETARALGEAGCEVVVSGRDPDRLDRAAAEVPNAHPITADVSTAAGADEFMEAALAELGQIDIVVTNAGGPPPGTFASTPISDFQAALDQNLTAMAAMCKASIPAMQERGWGRVLAITSLSVRQPMATIILSNTARTGLTSYLKTVALEVFADGVTVNTIQPGLHMTPRVQQLYGESPQFAPHEIGDAADFGQIAAFLCSEQAKFVTGASIPVAGASDAGLQ